MLVLSRSVGEKLILTLEDGREIEFVLTDLDKRRRQARIGIVAPTTVRIRRGELAAERKEQE